MKLTCTASVSNRSLASLNMKSNKRQINSTVALCRKPKTDSEFCLIYFTAKDTGGTRYEILNNIASVSTKFLNEGKCTIQFKVPTHDLYIQADAIQLKGFLHVLRLIIERKTDSMHLKFAPTTIVPSRIAAVKKLIITKRSDYPLRGLPRTLEILHINDIQKITLDKGVLNLIKLKVLDLSNNCIEYLSLAISNLPCLCQLNLSHNSFFKSSPKQWSWMSGNLAKNLKVLNISHNQMKFLPDQLLQLHSLINLNVDHNELQGLPSGIGNMRKLQIVTASNNRIFKLPGCVKKWNLQMLDLSHNNFDPNYQNNPALALPNPLPVCSLKELAASKTLFGRLPYSPLTLPETVIHFLSLAKYCPCGKACFNAYIERDHMLSLDLISQSYSLSSDHHMYVPITCYFCCLSCFATKHKRSNLYVMAR